MVIPADPTTSMDRPPRSKRIGVLIEAHFDETEFRRFNEVFPARGYELVYLSHLWGQPELTFMDGTFSTADGQVGSLTGTHRADPDGSSGLTIELRPAA